MGERKKKISLKIVNEFLMTKLINPVYDEDRVIEYITDTYRDRSQKLTFVGQLCNHLVAPFSMLCDDK